MTNPTPLLAGKTSLFDVQQSVYAALTSDPVFPTVCAGPYDPAPELTPFPYALFGEHIEMAWLSFRTPGRGALFMIHIFSRLSTFSEAYTILNAMNAVLDGVQLPLTNFYQAGMWFEQVIKRTDPDGLTRHLIVHYRTWQMPK